MNLVVVSAISGLGSDWMIQKTKKLNAAMAISTKHRKPKKENFYGDWKVLQSDV